MHSNWITWEGVEASKLNLKSSREWMSGGLSFSYGSVADVQALLRPSKSPTYADTQNHRATQQYNVTGDPVSIMGRGPNSPPKNNTCPLKNEALSPKGPLPIFKNPKKARFLGRVLKIETPSYCVLSQKNRKFFEAFAFLTCYGWFLLLFLLTPSKVKK